MREYNEELLHRVQQLELGILKDFVHVCEENHLTWWAFWGTGIGALRHGGFIPWDDDIDVCLPRKDYDRLLAVLARDYADRYEIVNGDTYETFPLATTRLTLRDSRFVEASLKDLQCPLGIFLDVYAFDHVAPDPKAAKRQMWKTWIHSKFLILRFIPRPVLPVRGAAAALLHLATAAVHGCLKLFRVSPRKIYRRMIAATAKYNDQPAAAYGFFADTAPDKGILRFEDLFPLRKIPFEDMELYFPNRLEEMLTVYYGDFAQLPPVEKRRNHFPYILKFPGDPQVYRADDEV